ncbi:hypothetical protein [Pseudarthrobacter enclensis]|uniref:Uncharacterized protein n=1 Tax=Pseudarthrobacter enclensis TaxID=993070 RepID=A0ABT9RZC6_9MICC|nr:hypothetical protein [Pseudarthrobacter enclensis]MDP9890570.1 hypothetical protein [Pseudarthrobacter enclensis]
MERSLVALPEQTYLARIGEVAYTVSSIEWTILGDLHRLADRLPDDQAGVHDDLGDRRRSQGHREGGQ